jgi:hypothetical protein
MHTAAFDIQKIKFETLHPKQILYTTPIQFFRNTVPLKSPGIVEMELGGKYLSAYGECVESI